MHSNKYSTFVPIPTFILSNIIFQVFFLFITKMTVLIERPKMSLAMWAALKNHIMRQREKKKQEQEADAAVERLQKEQEMKRKQTAMTLEEIKEEIIQLKKKLQSLRNEKHQMFLYFKRVLNEDKRRNEEDKEANEMMQMGHHYPNQNVPVGAPNLYMIAGNRMMNRNSVMYKVGNAPPPQQNGTMKRPRSPSPPNNSYPQAYGYKTHVTAYGQTYPIPHPATQFASQEQAKHLAANYHVPHMQQAGYVASLPQQIEHPPQKPTNMQDEKYYIQAGGISSGYPIRTQPPSHFQPPTSHSVTTPIQVPLRKEDVMRRNMNNEVHR
ncbi:uncharacterized protein TNIN_295561 [Trichonephila inaurata madagascariensis]|uniref:G protein pathway suppressor 2 n=1 Tax=Trichonephila inaurata madagascariensis TaxID=2747483 RepID=A0A8X6X7Z8_9ARAC|nr:uncharacterized protein TNIN_295561 [Trichonephila inaurata madagascariensis]